MAYPDRLLNDNETVSVDLHPHWWFLAGPVMAMTLAIAAAVVTLLVTEADSTVRSVAAWVALGAMALSALWLISRYGRWLTTHFVITNRRVIFRTGLLTKRGIEIPIDRVNTVHFHQSVWNVWWAPATCSSSRVARPASSDSPTSDSPIACNG